MSDNELLTVEEIADAAEREWRHRPSIETVRLWLRSGQLRGWQPSRRVGWRARESDVRTFLQETKGEGRVG